MRTYAKMIFVALCCALPLAGGCAKHELVKQEETIAPVTATPVKPSVAEPVKEPAVKQEEVKEQPIKETVVQEALKPVSDTTELKSALENVYFDLDAYTLSDKDRSTLAKDAELMKKYSSAKVQIEGNCDERGSDEYNLALGERRAQAAMEYLVTMGAPAKNLSVISYGKEKPADPGHDESAWEKNRRDDLTILK